MKKIIKIMSLLVFFAVFAFVLYSCIEGQVVIHGTIDRNAGPIKITHFKAIPVENGSIAQDVQLSSLKTEIQKNGQFGISVDDSKDWLFLFINTDSAGKETFVSQLAISLKNTSETLLLLPVHRYDAKEINLGKVKYGVDFSVTSKKMTAAKFTLSLEQLTKIAKYDNHFAGIRNYLAYAGSGSTIYYSLRTDFHWDNANPYSSIYTSFSFPMEYNYRSYNFQLGTNSNAVDIEEICIGPSQKLLELFPSSTLESFDPALVYNTLIPISNNNAVCSTASDGVREANDEDFYASRRYGDLSCTLGCDLITDPIPVGLWNYKIDGVLIGQFAPSVAFPKNSSNKIVSIVPGIRINKDASDRITSVSFQWYEENPADPAGYTLITDTAVLEILVSGAGVFFENSAGGIRRYESVSLPSLLDTSISPANVWYSGYSGTIGEQAERIGIFWGNGTIGQFVNFNR